MLRTSTKLDTVAYTGLKAYGCVCTGTTTYGEISFYICTYIGCYNFTIKRTGAVAVIYFNIISGTVIEIG